MRLDAAYLDSMRLAGDAQADEFIATLFRDNLQHELYAYLQLPDEKVVHNNNVPHIRNFFVQPLRFPAWYDAASISRGQAFFRKYALDIMTLLGAMALPYCYAASPGNKAIYFTGKMRKTPGKRLLETAHFIITVMKAGNFEEGGTAAVQLNKTRLIHALVRHYILDKTSWNMDWGMPVNQEDMAGTNLAFSYIILEGLEQAHYPLTLQEKEDFLHTWRFIGYQLHIDEALLPASFQEARQLEQVIRERHFKKSEEGSMLMKELIQHYKTSFPAIPAYFVDAQIRYFIGEEIAALLGMKPETVKDAMVRVMNRFKEWINRRYNNPYSYQIMLKNHATLRAKYSR